MLTALVEPCVASPSVVAAIPRGGLAVAVPIAARLRAPLTLVFARKLTVPSAPEFAIGAVDEDGTLLLDHAHAESVGATSEELDRARRGAQAEIERERAHYSAVPLAKLARGAAVVLVDDGLATGLTMRAAIAYARRCGARAVIVAAPCASTSAARRLRQEADHVLALIEAPGSFAVGGYYEDFRPVSDAEVIAILERSHASASG